MELRMKMMMMVGAGCQMMTPAALVSRVCGVGLGEVDSRCLCGSS